MMYFVETPSDPHVHCHQGTFFIVKNGHANFLRVVLNLQEMHYIFTKNLFFPGAPPPQVFSGVAIRRIVD